MTDNMKYRRLYHENQDFRTYVDNYCRTYRITVAAALEHKLVQEVGDQYEEADNERKEMCI